MQIPVSHILFLRNLTVLRDWMFTLWRYKTVHCSQGPSITLLNCLLTALPSFRSLLFRMMSIPLMSPCSLMVFCTEFLMICPRVPCQCTAGNLNTVSKILITHYAHYCKFHVSFTSFPRGWTHKNFSQKGLKWNLPNLPAMSLGYSWEHSQNIRFII